VPIRPYLQGVDVAEFDPDTIRAMGDAFVRACRALPSALDGDHVRRILAKKIIASAAYGERDPDRLRVAALNGLDLAAVAVPTAAESAYFS